MAVVIIVRAVMVMEPELLEEGHLILHLLMSLTEFQDVFLILVKILYFLFPI